ncbi:MAG: hypothetical protein CMI20_02050 [Opitutae bacterium]|nr:hypothetical protein [Opitutae bacterium]|tara:strand:- start:569 stop:847 length:279 start_codon:yes stop_codon:yes gene_type:complete
MQIIIALLFVPFFIYAQDLPPGQTLLPEYEAKIDHTRLIQDTSLSEDGKTLRIEIPEIAPCWQMSIRYEFLGVNGSKIAGEIQNTIHSLGDS